MLRIKSDNGPNLRIDIRDGAVSVRPSSRELMREWEELCARYLPVVGDSIWRYSRAITLIDPAQGWKLHISATVLTAGQILSKIGQYLTNRAVLFKAPCSLTEVNNLNCGLQYGYSQIGKCITVYPLNAEQARVIAHRLDQLTRGEPRPSVPFDLCYRPGSSVFYRYGAFNLMTVEQADGTRVPALRTPDGSLIPDRRTSRDTVPSWTTNPFSKRPGKRAVGTDSPLGKSIFAYKALSQRGKGGVYKAIETRGDATRLCVLKEGRRHGETAWDGRDGHWRVEHEQHVLEELAASGIGVPEVYTAFTSRGNYYLVLELIGGLNLEEMIAHAPTPLTPSQALEYGMQLSELLNDIHRAGWVWRDCKPSNLMVSSEGVMRPLDFEGAHPMDCPEQEPWGTLGYIPPELFSSRGGAQDLYALGAVLHRLFGGKLPSSNVKNARRDDLPPELSTLVESLLSPNPEKRPDARRATEILKATAIDMVSLDETQGLNFLSAA